MCIYTHEYGKMNYINAGKYRSLLVLEMEAQLQYFYPVDIDYVTGARSNSVWKWGTVWHHSISPIMWLGAYTTPDGANRKGVTIP